MVNFYSFFFFSTAWHKEPYSMGSYTAIGLGGQQAHIEKLAEPLYQRPNKRTVSFDSQCWLIFWLCMLCLYVCPCFHVIVQSVGIIPIILHKFAISKAKKLVSDNLKFFKISSQRIVSRGVREGMTGGAVVPPFFREFDLISLKNHPKAIFLMFCPPSFCTAPSVLEKLWRAWSVMKRLKERQEWQVSNILLKLVATVNFQVETAKKNLKFLTFSLTFGYAGF